MPPANRNDRLSALGRYVEQALAEERRIESALAAHLVMAARPGYQRRLQANLERTKLRAAALEEQLARLGGKAPRGPKAAGAEVRKAAKRVTDRAVELAEGSVEQVRRDAEASDLLENARAQYADATTQAGNYTVVRALAKAAGDKRLVRVAKSFRVEHEEMAEYVRKLIPKLSKATAEAEARTAEPKPRGRRPATGARAKKPAAARARKASGTAAKTTSAAKPARTRAAAKTTSAAKPARARAAAKTTSAAKPARARAKPSAPTRRKSS